MTAKPVPEHISDERLAAIIKGCEGMTPKHERPPHRLAHTRSRNILPRQLMSPWE